MGTRPFHLLLKPASADCNLRCEYCFYLCKAALYPDAKSHRMSEAVLETVIRTYMATRQPSYVFAWQGGEPTLMGVEFFRKVTEFQMKHGQPGARVSNGLQTNAVRIDDEFAAHLAEYRFLAGVSLDGPAEIHDRYRLGLGGQGSHEAVLRGISTLTRHGVAFNILVLVSQANVTQAREVYRYLIDQGFLHHQYIPCVEFGPDGRLAPYAITGEAWGDFLCALFEEWFPRDVERVSIRHVDAALARLVNGATELCTMARDCRQYFVVEHNGDLYPCDFYVEPRWKLGNVLETSWEEAQDSPVYRAFGIQKARWAPACGECPRLDLCAGDCLKHRGHDGNSTRNLSWLCKGWGRFFASSRTRLEELARRIRLHRATELRDPKAAPGAGRNELCPCGSGRKFKRCCGRIAP